MGMVVLLATSYLHISLLAYILDQFWPVQNFYHFFKKENSCLSRGGGCVCVLIKQMLYPFIHFKSCTKKTFFPWCSFKIKISNFPVKKSRKSPESKFMVGRYITRKISGWVRFTVCVHYPLFRRQCNMARERVHGLTETPKYRASRAEDHQEILHWWRSDTVERHCPVCSCTRLSLSQHQI